MGQSAGKCCVGSNKDITENFQGSSPIGDKTSSPNDENDKLFMRGNPNEIIHENTPRKKEMKKYSISEAKATNLTVSPKSKSISSSNTLDTKHDEKARLTTLQSYIKSYLYQKKYVNSIKQQQVEYQTQYYNDLYEQYLKYNTKLAESWVGYKFSLNNGVDILSTNSDNRPKEIKTQTFFTKVLNYPNKSFPSFYSGYVNLKNQKHGYGVELFSDGTKLEGYWVNNKFSGFGRFVNVSGDWYEGLFENGKINGQGWKRCLNGSVYIGSFNYGVKSGSGCEENEEIEYKGEFAHDWRNGKGKIIFKKTNETYEGEFENGIIHGIGIYVFQNEDIYQGEFKNGKMHGKGLYKWKSGEEYYGDYVNGIKEGNGIFKYLNGKIFDGQFKKGKPWGCGKLRIESKNKEYKVVFKNGEIVESEKPSEIQTK